MKKIIKTAALACAMLMAATAFAACGEESSTANSNNNNNTNNGTSVVSTPTANNNQIYNSNGILIAEDSAINTADSTAEGILTAVIQQQGLETEKKSAEGNMFMYVKGNTLVVEVDCIKDLTDSEKDTIGPSMEQSAHSMMQGLTQMKQYNLNIAVAVAVVENNGNVCYSKVFSA